MQNQAIPLEDKWTPPIPGPIKFCMRLESTTDWETPSYFQVLDVSEQQGCFKGPA